MPSPRKDKDEEEPKSMTIFRNNYVTSILPPWHEPRRKKIRRCSSVAEMCSKDHKSRDNEPKDDKSKANKSKDTKTKDKKSKHPKSKDSKSKDSKIANPVESKDSKSKDAKLKICDNHEDAKGKDLKSIETKTKICDNHDDDDMAIFENFSTRVAWSGRVKYAVDELEEENARRIANKGELFRDANRLLEITISTIILMSMRAKIPDENYVYTSLYLQNIHDDFGDHPPNISKILQLIQKSTKENNINWGENITQNYDYNSTNLDILKFSNKSSRIPVRSQKNTSSDTQVCPDP